MNIGKGHANTFHKVIKHLGWSLLLLLFCLGFAGCGKKEKAPELIDSVADIEALRPVTKRIVGKVETLEGNVVPKDYPCFPTCQVAISEVLVGVGDFVREGDVVAKADTSNLSEEYEEILRQIEQLTRHKTMAKEVSDLTLEKLGIERETEQILNEVYELEQKDMEIALQNEEFRYDMAVTESDLSALTRRRDKIKKELDSRTYKAPHDGFVTFVKDFSKNNYVESCENILVISDYEDLYIEATGIPTVRYQYTDYASKWTYLNGKKVAITEHPYTPEELSYAEGAGKNPFQSFDPVSGKLTLGSNMMLFFLQGDDTEKLAVGNDSINREGGESFVYIRNAAGNPEKRIVTLGETDGLYTEVKSGLSEGENVFYTNQYLPPSSYEIIEAGLGDFAIEDTAKSAHIAYPYTNFVIAPAGGILRGLKGVGSVSEGESLGSIITSEGVLAFEETKVALSKLNRGRLRERFHYEADRTNMTEAKKQIENVDAPDLTIDVDVEMPTNYHEEIRALRHLNKRMSIDLKILDRKEENAKQDYESMKKTLSARCEKLQKNANGDGIDVRSPVDGKVESNIHKDGDEVIKGSLLMTVMSGGQSDGSTILYVAMPEGGGGIKKHFTPLIGQKVVARKDDKVWTGTCVGVNGDEKRFMLFTRNQKQYTTYSAPFRKNTVMYQFYLKMDQKMTEEDMKELEIVFNGKQFQDVIVVPVLAVQKEYNMYSDTTKYYVWKLENDQIVKEYVTVYQTDATSGQCYILSGVKEKDKLLK